MIRSAGSACIPLRPLPAVEGLSARRYDARPDAREVSIGYTFLERRCWGGSVNREMKGLMLEHAFRFVDGVLFEIGAQNWRSRRAIEKLGATLIREETLDEHARVVYRIAKP